MKLFVLCFFGLFVSEVASAQKKNPVDSTTQAANTYKAEEDFSKKKKKTASKKAWYKAPRKVLPPSQQSSQPANDDKPKTLEEQIKDADQSDLDQAD
jgi:hypothetical protein